MINPFKKFLLWFIKRHPQEIPWQLKADSFIYSQNQKGIFPFVYIMGQTRFKTKHLLQRTNDQSLIIYLIYPALLLVGCRLFLDSNIPQQIQSTILNKTQNKQPKEFSSANLIIQEVLRRDQINQQLGRLIAQVCSKPTTQHNVTKQLNKLYTLSVLQKKTYAITKKILNEHLLYKDEIDQKLKQLIIRLMWNEKLRVANILGQAMHAKALQESTTQGFCGLLTDQNIRNILANNIAGYIRDFTNDVKTRETILKNLKSVME